MQLAATTDRVRRGVLLGALALLLAACGGDADDAAAEPDGEQAEATDNGDDGESSSDDATNGASDEDEDADEAQDLIPAEVTDEDGMATMRPPADAEPDCDSIDQLEPGASLSFPTDDAGMLDAGPGPVRVEFVGCSNTFEANLVYDAFHASDTSPTITDFTMGGSMGDWSAFSFEEMFWTPGQWTVVVYEDDAATGDRQEYDQVTFSID